MTSVDSPTPIIHLAPMEGVVDSALRQIFSKIGGYDQFTTEFIRVSQHLLPNRTFFKFAPELGNSKPGFTQEGVPVFIQLLGSDPELMAENAQKAAELNAPGIDLNFGCPAKTVNRHDGGARLLKDPDRIYKILSTVTRAVPQIAVTAKVRLGFDSKERCIEIAKAVEDGGARRITIHARTKVEGYKPPAHWTYIAKMKSAIKIPVVANGDIWNLKDFHACQEITGCTSFALGRPAIACPDLGHKIKKHHSTVPSLNLGWAEMLQDILPNFIDIYRLQSHEKLALCRIKQWTKFLARHYPEALSLFNNIKTAQSLSDLCESGLNLQHLGPNDQGK